MLVQILVGIGVASIIILISELIHRYKNRAQD